MGHRSTLLLIDREGRLRRQTLGHIPDLQLGAEIMALMRESSSAAIHPLGKDESARHNTTATCDDQGCPIPAADSGHWPDAASK